MFKRFACVLALSVCGSTLAADADPQWLVDARARESRPQKPRAIESADKWFKAQVPAKLVGAIEKADDSYSLSFASGGKGPVNCEVIPGGIDLAGYLRANRDYLFAAIEKTQGKVETRAVTAYDAGAYGDSPYLQLTWLYRVRTDKGAMLGEVKQIAFEEAGHGVYCFHNDLGYTKTFANIVKGFAETLEIPEKRSKPYYHEIATMRINDTRIGVLVVKLEKDDEGYIKAEQIGAMFSPEEGGDISSHDSFEREWVDKDNSLINAFQISVENGEVESELSLSYKDDNGWMLDGTMQGKKVSQKLNPQEDPGTWLRQAVELREVLAADNPVGVEHSIDMWLDIDPAKLTPSTTRILKRLGPKEFEAINTIGPMEANIVLESDTGMLNHAEIKMGPQVIVMDRVFVEGRF
jgi:hypothetical protein